MSVRTINFRLELDVLNFNASLRLPLFLTCFISRNATSYLIYFTDSELWELVHSTENITALKYLYVIFEAGGRRLFQGGWIISKTLTLMKEYCKEKLLLEKLALKTYAKMLTF